MHKKLLALLCVGVMITIAGCGASNLPTTPVSGTVSFDGEPLEGATVTLSPDAGSAGSRSASGISVYATANSVDIELKTLLPFP